MKNKKSAESLTQQALAISWPGSTDGFRNFQSTLRDLVGLNFGYTAQQSFGYDEYSRTFYWAADERTIINLRGTLIAVKRNFSLDPHKPVEEEFERICKEYGAFQQAARDVAKALRTIGGEVH